jgi:hypothetical protein
MGFESYTRIQRAFDAQLYVDNTFSKLISNSFKILIEQKHLYQNLNIDVPGYDDKIDVFIPTSFKHDAKLRYKQCLIMKWILSALSATIDNIESTLKISLPTVKIYCAICNRIEAYNPISGNDELNAIGESYNVSKTQVFLLFYQCQSCKGLPESFLIARKELKLSIVGRYPIEKVDTPKYLPKEFSKFISDALIAFNSGHILAGLFFLRVFIEQYTKKVVNDDTLKADETIQKYAEGLPTDFKERFPSLMSIYSKLSGAIHNANADEDLFNESLRDIREHFDAKRVFKI